MKTALGFIALYLVLAGCLAAQGQKPVAKLDRGDAAATAAAFLRAYAAKDLPAMAELANDDNRRIIQELKAQGESHPRWRSVFAGGRWDAVSTWKGNLGETRYFERTVLEKRKAEAEVHFAEALTPGKIVVVTLTWEAGKWCFEDINYPRREAFEQGSKSRPAMP
jgi:hypothetical protein